MKVKGIGSVRLIFLLAAVLVLIFTVVNYRTGNVSPNNQIWRGYFTLMVKEDASFNAERLLHENGTEFISLSNQTIDFFDYCGMRSILLTELDENLEALDPRIDPYMTKLPSFFSATYNDSEWELFYIKTDNRLVSVQKDLERVFPEENTGEWILADDRLKPNPWFPLFFALFFGLSGILLGKSAARILLYAIPWIGFFRSGSLPLFTACGLIILAILFLRSRIVPIWKKHLNYSVTFAFFREKMIFPLLLFISSFVAGMIWIFAMGFGLKSIIFTFSGIVGLFFALLVELCYEYLKVKGRDHKFFIPVFILGRQEKGILSMDFIIAVVPALVLASILILPVDMEVINAPVPAPVFNTSDNQLPGYDWEGISSLERSRVGNRYPDLVDYVSHAGYQEVFFYGGEYGFPNYGDKLEQEVVQFNEGDIEKDVIVLKEFTDDWYADILSIEEKDGVIALLLNQKAPCRIESAGTIITGNKTEWKKVGFALFTLYFSEFLLLFIIKSRRKSGIRHKESETITYIREIEKEHIA